MKRLSIFFTLVMAVSIAHADPIDRNQARQKAAEFLTQRGRNIELTGNTAFKAPRQGASEDAYLYIFNAENNNGFVVISGDTNTDLILGYADSGSIDEANMPDHIRDFLNGLAEEVRIAGEKNLIRKTTRRNGQAAKHAVAPLMTSQWNQGDPYNMFCPIWYHEDGTPGNLCATGCVATAIAQVINFYKYPDKLAANIPAHTLNPGGGPVEVRMPAIRKNTPIDWEHMCDTYSSSNTQEEKEAVAKLMLMCGQALEMGYGPSSGAVTARTPDIAKTYFGFDDDSHWESRNSYSADQWTDLIYNEIATGHPVCYSGHSTGGGHAFVLDGFDGDQLFHVNWGWGGGSDGWFKIAILNPGDNSGIGASATTDGYSMSQGACIGMKLPDDIVAPNRRQLTIRDPQVEGSNKIRATVINWCGMWATFDYSLCTIEEDGSLKPFGAKKEVTLNTNNLTSVVLSLSSLDVGTHKVVPASKFQDAEQYMTTMETWREYFIVEVPSRGVYNISFFQNSVDLEVTEWTPLNNCVVNQDQKIQTTFVNHGDEFYGEVHFFASMDEEDKGEQICRSMLVLKPGYTENLMFNFKPTEPGTYHMWITFDNEGQNVLAHSTVEITETSTVNEQLRINTVSFNGISSGGIYGDFISGKFDIKNKGLEDIDTEIQLTLWISWNDDNYYNSRQRKVVPVKLEAGQTTSIDFFFDNCVSPYKYAVTFNYVKQDGSVENGHLAVHKIYLYPGIISYKNDGTKSGTKPAATIRTPKDAVAVDMRNQSVVKNGSASLDPQCLYFVDTDYEVPAFLEGHNIVKDGECGDVVLNPEWGFYAPEAFTPSSISYNVVIPEDNATAWQTLSLPFVPTEVTIDGQVVTWKKNNNDSEGAFYLQQFYGIDDEGIIRFDFVDEFITNIPYLIAGTEALAGKTIEFKSIETKMESTKGKVIVAGINDYSFFGTLMPTKASDGTYMINETGDAFVPAEDGTAINPYTAYFVCKIPEAQRPANIPIEIVPSGISPVFNTESSTSSDIYTITGVKMNSTSLPKGIYIIGGKKVVK